MLRQVVRVGVVGGIVGGAVMAMWSMGVLWFTGLGLWTPLNLIAHTFWRSIPIDATFSVAGVVVGTAIHMVVAIILGVGLTAVARWAALPVPVLVLVAIVAVLTVWLVMQFLVWMLIDSAAAQTFTPWVMGIGHLTYGMMLVVVNARSMPAPPERTFPEITARPASATLEPPAGGLRVRGGGDGLFSQARHGRADGTTGTLRW